MDKNLIAEKYTNEILEDVKKLIKQAFIKGFELGCSNPIVSTIQENGVKYIDLGLPSGTLWSEAAYRKSGATCYTKFSHVDAQGLNLPSEQQVKELCQHTKAIVVGSTVKIVGPNGQRIMIKNDKGYNGEGADDGSIMFWVSGAPDNSHAAPVCQLWFEDGSFGIQKHFAGYKLPVLLTKSNK